MMKKKLSIITPVFNRMDCLPICLDSVAQQAVPENWEIEHIVIDDGSSDSSPDIIKKYSNSYSHIVPVILPSNRGTNGARNAGLRAATGKWVTLLDSDDAMLPDAVCKICRTLDNNSNDYIHFLFATDDTIDKRSQFGRQKELSYHDFLNGNVFGDFVHVLLADTMRAFPFREDLRIYESLFFLHYYRTAGRVLYLSDVLFHRDRSREDHVSFSLFMTNDTALHRKISAKEFNVENYAEDYLGMKGGKDILTKELKDLCLLNLMSGNYIETRRWAERLRKIGQKPSAAVRVLSAFRMGPLAWNLAKFMTKIKHRLN